MTPQTVNAYYNPTLNEIVFPASVLQPPFFDADADDAVNYGAIGTIIGHEISHGFDDEGSQFDGTGNLRAWWSAADRQRFEDKTKVLVAQYSAFTPLAGYQLNGELTLGENIADNSGLEIAYKAYHRSLAGKPAPLIDGTTGDERFFYGFAQAFRGKRRDAALLAQIKSDPHSPDEFRVNGAARNHPAFQATFGVKPGDALYLPPEQRVSIW
jgi:predicted metalloendopeptidase